MNRSEVCDRFITSVPYSLYPFQEEALLTWFTAEGGMLVSAPTGMGKTLLAEAAIFEALQTGQRLYYTSPLIALTDQKFREFQERAEAWGFSKSDVGLLTGNRKENPDARVLIVVAEILLNHLLESNDRLSQVQSVVMDEFHYFNDFERGIVWELSLVLLPPQVRLMLLSATVGNCVEFVQWLAREHGRRVQLVRTDERRVPLEYQWVGDRLLTEHLPLMVSKEDSENRAPALVFCFNRDECWEVAERLKGLSLIDPAARGQIEELAPATEFADGVGPKLRQMLIRGVGVHHAGVLPKYKEIVERLFLRKLVPFVICTETLAAGINLPARSVVLSTLLHGKPGERKLVAPSSAHQMFGRAGRPQFDAKGYVFVLAHEDDAKIAKWRKKYEQIDPNSKDPGILRARKELERKRPTRRKTEEYWTEGQFKSLIAAGPAKLVSRSMVPYQVLVFLLRKTGTLHEVREFLSKRFNTPDRLEEFQRRLDRMIGNLVTFGYLLRAEDGDHVTLHESIHELADFRSVDPLYGAFLCKHLAQADLQEKMQALESVLSLPPALERSLAVPESLPAGPLQTHVLEPLLIQMGVALTQPGGGIVAVKSEADDDPYAEFDEEPRPLRLPEMLRTLYEAKLATPEGTFVAPKWVLGGILEHGEDFFRFVKAKDLLKNEGLVLRHLLRLVILGGEFLTRSGGDPDYERIASVSTRVCQRVDARYTDRFLAAEEEAKKVAIG